NVVQGGELRLRLRQKQLPKRPAATNLVFPQPRLRLMDAQRRRLASRQAVLLGRQSLLVQAVAGLVEDTEKSVAKIIRVVARRDPHVARPGAAAERMIGHVEPPSGEIEADRCGRLFAKLFLSLDREIPHENGTIRSAAAAD